VTADRQAPATGAVSTSGDWSRILRSRPTKMLRSKRTLECEHSGSTNDARLLLCEGAGRRVEEREP